MSPGMSCLQVANAGWGLATRLLQGRLESVDELDREVLDEANRVGDQHRVPGRQGRAAGGGVQGCEQPICRSQPTASRRAAPSDTNQVPDPCDTIRMGTAPDNRRLHRAPSTPASSRDTPQRALSSVLLPAFV